MIRSLKLQDFQSHKKFAIEFAPGITTIVGDTDVGKSAIIRALRWVCQNTPQGADFVRWGAKTATATVQVEDQTIVRSRGKGENGYAMGEGEFKAFGIGVPDEIAKVLKLSDLNFQAQHDAPFWLSIGGTEVARQMNQIVNLEVIDGVLGAVADRLRKAKTQAEFNATRRNEAKTKLESLSPILDADESLKLVEKAEAAWQQTSARAQRLGELTETLSRLAGEVERAARGKQRGEILVKLAGEWRQATETTDNLHSLLLTMRQSRKVMQAAPDFAPVEEAWKAYHECVRRRELLEDRLTYQRGLWRDRRDTQATAKEVQLDLSLRTAGICPICGGPLKS